MSSYHGQRIALEELFHICTLCYLGSKQEAHTLTLHARISQWTNLLGLKETHVDLATDDQLHEH